MYQLLLYQLEMIISYYSNEKHDLKVLLTGINVDLKCLIRLKTHFNYLVDPTFTKVNAYHLKEKKIRLLFRNIRHQVLK